MAIPELNEISGKFRNEGLLMPMIKNRFRVIIGHRSSDIRTLLSAQTLNCSIDYIEFTIKIDIEQNTSDIRLHEAIKSLVDDHVSIHVQPMAFDDKPVSSLEFTRCKLIDHSFDLDYADSEAAKHCLTFMFDDIQGYEQEDKTTDKTTPAVKLTNYAEI